MHLGIWEILIILVVAMLFFGPKKLADIGPALGHSVRGFKRAMNGEDEPKPGAPTALPSAKADGQLPPPTTPPTA
ncbi:MAG: twin-arginine translocase TatA/TatE family subunit [Deltaproteobacteria bacterium]